MKTDLPAGLPPYGTADAPPASRWALLILAILAAACTASCNDGIGSFAPSSNNQDGAGPADDGGSGERGDDVSPPPDVKVLKVKINEVMVSNSKTLADEAGTFSPWIELYNPTDAAADLAGLALSDDLGQAAKWVVPRVSGAVIPPRGFLVVFCDGGVTGDRDLHASFTLSPGFLQLILNKGSDLFFFDASQLEPDRSAGRSPDGSEGLSVLAAPTPGSANEGPAPPPEATFIRGDANGDTWINVTDMTGILGFLFHSRPAPACRDRLDADDDGEIDISDALYVGAALFRHGPPFPEPFPDPGLDPTPDEIPCAEQ